MIVEISRLSTAGRRTVLKNMRANCSLSMELFEILDLIKRGVTPPGMALELEITHQGIMARMQRLERRGYIERVKNGRGYDITMTKTGEEAFFEFVSLILKETAQLLALITDEELTQYLHIMRKMGEMNIGELPFPDRSAIIE